MNNLLKLKDLRIKQSVLDHLPQSRPLVSTIVDDRSLEVITRIEAKMKELAPTGDDEQRSFWIKAYKGCVERWYYIGTANYRHYHHLFIQHGQFFLVNLSSTESGCYPREKYRNYVSLRNVEKELLQIEELIAMIIHSLKEDPNAYNEYVAQNLSYGLRKGKIKRSELNRIAPVYRLEMDELDEIGRLCEARLPATEFDKMTLRKYMFLWRVAHEAVYGEMKGLSDKDVFKHSSQGYEAMEQDLDSEQDFVKWSKENSSFHCHDVVYARVQLWPTRSDENGKWHLGLYTASYWNLEDCLKSFKALNDAGIHVELGPLEKILAIIHETDYVAITPFAYRYMCGGDVGNEIKLPEVGEGITRRMVNEIIASAEWEPIKPIRLMANTISG